MATIVTKNSSTASAVPTTSDLVQGELAVNVTDKRIFTENASTQIVELGTNPSTVTTATATVTGTLTANGTFASNNAVITGGSVNSTPIGATTPSTIVGSTVTANTGFVGGLTGNVTGNLTGNVTGNVAGNLTGNVTGNVTASSGTTTLNDLVVNGTADFTNTKLTNVVTPTAGTDAANKSYVDDTVAAVIDSAPAALDTLNELAAALGDDANFAGTVTTALATKLPLAGGTMTGAIAMGTSKITGLGDPTSAQDAATKTYVDTADALKLNFTGGTMSGAIAMGTNKITGLGDPTLAQDAATKTYVDDILGSATSAATSAAAAATSASNAATSASNAATSASNAASSATASANSASAAAASYDAFDDRYLGDKASDPTLDNDGNALLTGALYFNTITDAMRVYNGTAWQDTSTNPNSPTFNGTVTADGLTVNADALIHGVTVGRGAGSVSTNTAVGSDALAANTTGDNNTANGYQALYSNTAGRFNTAYGAYALYLNTTGNTNTASGRSSLYSNTTGTSNAAFGDQALSSNTTANNNTATGARALLNNTTGTNNVANGCEALRSNTTGNYNVATGFRSLVLNTTGTSNVATGYESLYNNTTGHSNVASGVNALYSNTTGVRNTASGINALQSNTASNNTALGYQAGNSLTTGSNNTVIGYDADASSATVSNEITLGNNSVTRFRIPGIGIDWTSADVSIGTLTKTFTAGESSTIDLASSVLAPLVTVTKEIPQTGVTSNSWDVNSNTENYTRLDSAYATTLDFNRYDLSSASYTQSFSVAGQEDQLRGIAFNTDGTKMFVIGASGDDVNEYDLSTAFDVSTAVYSQNFSVAAQDTSPTGIAFNNDGTKMFIVGAIGDAVYEYTLSTGFDVSTASYSQSLSVAAQETTPTDLSFNANGTKMFILGYTGDDVNEYTLSTGFDLSTASYSQNFSISAQETNPTGIAFNADGTKMFITGTVGDDVNEYSLSTGFDVSTASYSQNFSVSAQETAPEGIAFNTDGTKMFVVGDTGDAVFEYYLTPSLELGTGSFASSDIGKTVEANSGKFVLTNTDGRCAETTQPTSYAQVASGDWEMYGVIYNPVDGDLELSGVADPNLYFDITTAIYEQSFSVAAAISSSEAAFNNDGTKMFIVDQVGEDVVEYSLSIAFDISTAFFVHTFSVSAQETQPSGVAFNTDGTKMFVCGFTGDAVYEYDLSTGFDVSSAVYSQTFSVSAQEGFPRGLAFNNDGTKMFIVGNVGDDINEYNLSTGFDVSSAVYSQRFSVAAQDTFPRSVAFNANGTEMFIAGGDTGAVYKYKLETGFDVLTAYFVDSISVSAQDSSPSGVVFNNDGSKMYIVSQSGDAVFQYAIGQAYPTGYQSVHTTASIDSTYWTDINSMTADQNAGTGNVYYAISTDDRTTWTVIDNTGERDIVRNNAGTWQYNSNSAYASETWVNGSTNNELATLSQSMEGASRDATYDISLATFEKQFSVVNQETTPLGLAFNNDGTKMYVVGTTGDDVNEYNLSVAFDISSAVYSQNFSVSAQEANPQDVAFNNDGTKMFIVGADGDEVNEYDLSSGFDVSTASYSQNFSVSAQELVPTGIAFNTDGTKMFIVGSNGNDVNEYDLSSGFDVSTASFVDSFSVSAQESEPTGIAFNADGTKMFIVGSIADNVNEYDLSVGFDVSTAVYSRNFSVASQELNAQDIAFNNDGTKMYIVGATGDAVYQYDIPENYYANQMDKTQLDAVTDPNHIALSNDLDLAMVFNMTNGTTVPSSNGIAIDYDANVLNKGAILGTDYDFDAPAQDEVRITSLINANLKVRVV
jgi:SpoU rRNA methylase family enzyme